MKHIGNLIFWIMGIVILCTLVVAVVRAIQARAKHDAANRFKAKAFLTANELEFLHRLEQAVPELRFHAQVAMGALLDPVVTRKQDWRMHLSARRQFSQKIVDYLAQHRESGKVVAIIELDDRTHDTDKDRKRDAMLGQGGYRIIRWQSTRKPDAAAIRAALMAFPSALSTGPAGNGAP